MVWFYGAVGILRAFIGELEKALLLSACPAFK
jgi:hypothetical protein